MRILLAALFAAPLLISGAIPSQAEKRIFVIANSPDDYGVDRCLSGGHACGAAAAAAYCQAKEFSAGGVLPQGEPRRDNRRSSN